MVKGRGGQFVAKLEPVSSITYIHFTNLSDTILHFHLEEIVIDIIKATFEQSCRSFFTYPHIKIIRNETLVFKIIVFS